MASTCWHGLLFLLLTASSCSWAEEKVRAFLSKQKDDLLKDLSEISTKRSLNDQMNGISCYSLFRFVDYILNTFAPLVLYHLLAARVQDRCSSMTGLRGEREGGRRLHIPPLHVGQVFGSKGLGPEARSSPHSTVSVRA